jgi:hypothetical protein
MAIFVGSSSLPYNPTGHGRQRRRTPCSLTQDDPDALIDAMNHITGGQG